MNEETVYVIFSGNLAFGNCACAFGIAVEMILATRISLEEIVESRSARSPHRIKSKRRSPWLCPAPSWGAGLFCWVQLQCSDSRLCSFHRPFRYPHVFHDALAPSCTFSPV